MGGSPLSGEVIYAGTGRQGLAQSSEERVERMSQEGFEKRISLGRIHPTTAKLTLYCPDCGDESTMMVEMLDRKSSGERQFGLRDNHTHICQPSGIRQEK